VSNIGLSNHLANHFKVGTAGDQVVDLLSLKTQMDLMGLSTEALTGLRTQMEIEIEKAKIFLQMAEKGSIS